MPCLVIVCLIRNLFGFIRIVTTSIKLRKIAIIASEDAEGDPQDQAQEPEGFE